MAIFRAFADEINFAGSSFFLLYVVYFGKLFSIFVEIILTKMSLQ